MKMRMMVALAAVVLGVVGFAEDMRIWNGGMPVGPAAWYLRDSTPQRLIKGNGPVGPSFVNYRDGKICDGDMPGTPLWIYKDGKLWKGPMPVGKPACEFRANRIFVNATQIAGVFTPNNKRFFKGTTPVGNPAFTWKGDWPEAMLVYIAYRQYLNAGPAPAAAPAAAGGAISADDIFKVLDASGKVVCTYAQRQIWDGDTVKGAPAWNYDAATKSFRKGTDKTGAPVATFKGRYLYKGDGSDPAQYYIEHLMMCLYEPGKQKPDSFGCWSDTKDFMAVHSGSRTYQTPPTGGVLLSFPKNGKDVINVATKYFIVWKYLLDK